MKNREWLLIVVTSLCLTSCGGEVDEFDVGAQENTAVGAIGVRIEALEPVSYSFAPSTSNPNQFQQVTRNLGLNAFDQFVEPILNPDRTQVTSVIVGLGVEAVVEVTNDDDEVEMIKLPVRLGVWAREWDNRTKSFIGSPRMFSAQGQDLSNSQQILFSDSNVLLSGLALKLYGGRFTKLEVLRADFEAFREGSVFGIVSAENRVELPAGWVAVGFTIGVDRAVGDAYADTQDPFLSDMRGYSGRLRND